MKCYTIIKRIILSYYIGLFFDFLILWKRTIRQFSTLLQATQINVKNNIF